MLILPQELPIKPYLAWGINRAGHLTTSGHASLKAAKRGTAKIKQGMERSTGSGVLQYGWTKIEPRDRQYGIVL